MKKIFISHSSKDEAFSRKIAVELRKSEYQTWLDVEDIPPGIAWRESIQRALDACDVMVLILSPDSMASEQVEKEWSYFQDERKLIVPIYYRNTENIHFQIRNLHYIDFEQRGFNIAFQDLDSYLRYGATPTQPTRPVVSPISMRLFIVFIAISLFCGFISIFMIPRIPEWLAVPTGELITAVTFAPTDTSAPPTSTIAPRNDMIAFQRLVGDFEHIHTIDLSSCSASGYRACEERALTVGRNHFKQASWSPDGSRIAYISLNGNAYNLGIMNADGSGQHLITTSKQASLTYYYPSWSPNGFYIAFRREYQNAEGDYLGDLYLSNPDGLESRLLVDGSIGYDKGIEYPAWSPDNSQIVFSSAEINSNIYIYDFATGTVRTLLEHACKETAPSWSPDGTQIAYHANCDGDHEIYVVNVSGNDTPRQLTHNSARDMHPTWSPDGTLLAFQSNRDGDHDIYIMDVEHGDEEGYIWQLTVNDVADLQPVWRP